jgi:hypothetical protein
MKSKEMKLKLAVIYVEEGHFLEIWVTEVEINEQRGIT